MNREKLLQNPLPIDRVAARVASAARPENLWRPTPKAAGHHRANSNFLKTAPLPSGAIKANPALSGIVGKRRDRMVVVGYAEDQGSEKQSSKWVVRCDCGNYEHRKRILRWLGTAAEDMCSECHKRNYLLNGWEPSKPPAERCVKEAA